MRGHGKSGALSVESLSIETGQGESETDRCLGNRCMLFDDLPLPLLGSGFWTLRR